MEDARMNAMADLDYAINLTQQSGRQEFLNFAQRGNAAGKILTQFAGPKFARFGIELEALHRMAMEGDKTAIRNYVSKAVALHLVAPTILTAVNVMAQSIFHNPDDDEWLKMCLFDGVRNAVLGPLGGWFIAGAMMETAWDGIAKPMAGIRNYNALDRSTSPMPSKLAQLAKQSTELVMATGYGIDEAINGTLDESDIEDITKEALDLAFWALPGLKSGYRAVKNAVNLYEDLAQ